MGWKSDHRPYAAGHEIAGQDPSLDFEHWLSDTNVVIS